ncbi:MAG: GGDEF domain-containing protein [Treponema sp.]|nr:GGDEF domain-containing protein [Treponema sp.]
MNIKSKIRKQLAAAIPGRTNTLLKENRTAALNSDLNRFRMISLVGTVIMGLICLIGICLPPEIIESEAAYLLIFGSSIVFYLLFSIIAKKEVTQDRTLVLVFIYLFIFSYYVFAIYTSAFVSKGFPSVTFIGLQLIFPVLLLDNMVRINLMLLGVYILNILSSYFLKSFDIFLIDVVSTGAFTLAGMFIGAYMRRMQMEYFEKSRELIAQRNTDVLTTLSNRRVLFETLDRNVSLTAEKQLSGIIMIDIDFFKKYNDTYGHQAGDTCLRSLGNRFTEFGEKYNIRFFRYGGEEFTALCTGYTKEELGIASENLRKAIVNLGIPFPATIPGTITISIGYAHKTDCSSNSYEELIQLSDKALYVSKTSGRNRVSGYQNKK